MNIIQIKIVDLKPASYNPRKISQKDMDDLVRGIAEFGFVEPIVVNKDMTIIGGHQRVTAALHLDFDEVPAYVVDLSPEKAKALNIALNKIQGEWDYEKLQGVMADLPPNLATLSGFSHKELEKLVTLFADTDVNLDEDLSDFERESKNHEFRILIPKDDKDLLGVKGGIKILKEKFPQIIIKEVM